MGAKQVKKEIETDRNKNLTVSFQIENQDTTDLGQVEENFIFSKNINFRSNLTFEFTKNVIYESLLKHESISDKMAALAVWISVQRFMGDLPDLESVKKENIAIINHVDLAFKKDFNKRDLKNAQRYSKRLDKRSKSEKQTAWNPFLVNRQTTFLEKLHLITSIGILRSELRNEIYCQICKQLTSNQNKTSKSRGWILLALCIGCFPPSDELLDFIFNFIRKGPNNYSKYCYVRLKRTLTNGVRAQPPSCLELKAAKSSYLLALPITFIDGRKETIYADSATTSRELIDALAKKLNLQYENDFSINISIYEQMHSLGYGDNHVMDAISECEQYAKVKYGTQEQSAPWKLFLNRDVFVGDLIYYEEYLVSSLPINGAEYGETHC